MTDTKEVCRYWNCKRPAVRFVHAEMPTDLGVWDPRVMVDGTWKCVRPPDGKKPDHYHLPMCEEHFLSCVEEYPNEECKCPTPGKWPWQAEEEERAKVKKMLEVIKGGRDDGRIR